MASREPSHLSTSTHPPCEPRQQAVFSRDVATLFIFLFSLPSSVNTDQQWTTPGKQPWPCSQHTCVTWSFVPAVYTCAIAKAGHRFRAREATVLLNVFRVINMAFVPNVYGLRCYFVCHLLLLASVTRCGGTTGLRHMPARARASFRVQRVWGCRQLSHAS